MPLSGHSVRRRSYSIEVRPYCPLPHFAGSISIRPGGLAQPRGRHRPRQAEMVAQRLPLVVAAHEAAVLEFRHDEVDKIGECAGDISRQYIVTVGGTLEKPLFEGVGNPSRGAADDPMAAGRGGKVVEVAQGHILSP